MIIYLNEKHCGCGCGSCTLDPPQALSSPKTQYPNLSHMFFTWVYKNVINIDPGEGQEDYNK